MLSLFWGYVDYWKIRRWGMGGMVLVVFLSDFYGSSLKREVGIGEVGS